MKILVTGGAGFIGSHLVEFLVESGHETTVLDNLSVGKMSHLEKVKNSPLFKFVLGNIQDQAKVDEVVAGQDFVFHLCDNSDIRFAAQHAHDYVQQNIVGGFYVLEAMKKHGVKKIAFPSSTTVLGDADVVPTPENYGPLKPMNLYGGAKVAMEGLLSAYAYTYDMQAWIFRFVDIVGGRIDHGVIYDFICKLSKNPKDLEILGDGSQRRSFLLVDECIRAIWLSIQQLNEKVNVVHIGNRDQINITQVGEIVKEEMGLSSATSSYTGGKKGWKGDAFTNFIECGQLNRLNCFPELNSAATVHEAARRLIKQIKNS